MHAKITLYLRDVIEVNLILCHLIFNYKNNMSEDNENKLVEFLRKVLIFKHRSVV